MNTKSAGPQKKLYEMKGEIQENCIRGNANVMGILDRGGDVTFPGFFRKALPAFRKNGFVALGHAWRDLPIAMPTMAKEQGSILYSEAEFHSTEEAQKVRQVCMERIDKGLSVGLSVGFMPDYEEGIKFFENGKDLLTHAEKVCQCDMSLFDVDGIKKHKSYCWGLLPDGCDELFEWSVVTVPMNQASYVTEIKGQALEIQSERAFEAFLREAGFTRKQAVAITLHGYKAFQRDADEAESEVSEQQVIQLRARLLKLRLGASHEGKTETACASN